MIQLIAFYLFATIVIASGDPLRSRLINRRFTLLTGYTIENAPDIEAL